MGLLDDLVRLAEGKLESAVATSDAVE